MFSFRGISKQGQSQIKVKGSKFLGYAYQVDDEEQAKQILSEVKKEHHKATHHCYAYRIGLENVREIARDDGEPSGTAGIPILGQIISRNLYNVLVVSVRYYGGTKLGTGGLKNAYKESASTSLDNAEIKEYTIYNETSISVPFAENNAFLQSLYKIEGEVLNQKIDQLSEWEVRVPKKYEQQLDDLKNNYADLAKKL